MYEGCLNEAFSEYVYYVEESHIITRSHSLTSGGRCSTYLQLQLQLAPVTHSILIYTIALTNLVARPFMLPALTLYYHCTHI